MNEVRSKFNKARYYVLYKKYNIQDISLYLYCTLRDLLTSFLLYPTIENPTSEIIRVIGYFSHDYALDGKPFGFLTRRAIS